MSALLYGSGLRLLEGLRLRVKDVEFGSNRIVVRDAKGNRDRVVPLPLVVRAALPPFLSRARRLHNEDLAAGFGRVFLPDALDRKYPAAARDWDGNGSFPPTIGAVTRGHKSSGVITCTRPWCNEP